MSFTTEELAKAVSHLAFDSFHFQFYGRHLNDRSSPAAQQAVRYSLLLHFRVLWDFFYEPPIKDDCAVVHFRVFPEVKAALPEIKRPDGGETLSKSLNKRLVHMTATRWREPQPDMDFYARYFDGINALIARFQQALPDELRECLVASMQTLQSRYEEHL